MLASGYDRSFERIGAPVALRADARRPALHREGDRVRLDGPGLLDLGGVAKGWTVDRVYDWLCALGAAVALGTAAATAGTDRSAPLVVGATTAMGEGRGGGARPPVQAAPRPLQTRVLWLRR